jgi:hypothetical protein
MNFPVFGTGATRATPADSLGRLDVISIGGPIKIDGVRTKNSDDILGNIDGVVIIPLEIAEEAIKLAGKNTAAKNWQKASLLPKCSVNTESCNKRLLIGIACVPLGTLPNLLRSGDGISQRLSADAGFIVIKEYRRRGKFGFQVGNL